MNFPQELRTLLRKQIVERPMTSADYILASYLIRCLELYAETFCRPQKAYRTAEEACGAHPPQFGRGEVK